MYVCGKVCLVNRFPAFFLNDYVRGNQFTEVVHCKSGKNLLGNVLHLFALEQAQANGVKVDFEFFIKNGFFLLTFRDYKCRL